MTSLVCQSCGFVFYNNPKPTVSAFVFDENNCLLLTKRAVKPYRYWWDLPGGFVNFGELPEEALARELFEELSIKVKKHKFLGVSKDIYLNKGYQDEKYSIISLFYLVKSYEGEIKAGSDVCDYKFFKKRGIPINRIAFKAQRDFVRRYFGRKRS